MDEAERTIPKAYRWASVAAPELVKRVKYSTDDVVALAERIAATPLVVLMGAPGVGKTSLAVAALRLAISEAPRDVRFVGAGRLGSARIQNAAGSGEAPLVQSAISARILLFDDLGSERKTQTNAVPDVIVERHAEERATWYTTGFSLEDIERMYGGGIGRRVFEHALVLRLGDGGAP
jgi:DNA replication protein DnaC